VKRLSVAALVGLLATSVLLAVAAPARAGAPPNRLDNNGGRVLAHPKIHNLYMDTTWNSDNPAAISRSEIDGFTSSLVGSNYFSKAAQYGVGSASFSGSDEASILPCPPPIIGGVTEFLAITAWMECMTAPGDPIIRPVLSGIPAPDDDTVYAVYLPTGTQINDIFAKSCSDFGAYHFMGETLVWRTKVIPVPPFVIPILEPQSFAFAVLPVDCASGGTTIDGISELATHELIEAATDPIVLASWIDNSKIGFNADILKAGEAADICEQGVGDVPTPPARLTNGLLVAPYWSNADNRCVPVTHTIHLGETGLPGSVPHQATFDGSTVSLPFDTIVDDGTSHSWSFPSPVADPNPGTRYVTSEPATTLTVTSNQSRTAAYHTQHFLTVQAVPPAAAALDASLTPSAWVDEGTVVTLHTDALITTGPGARFRFDHWSGDVSSTSPTTTVTMNAPKTATANYVSQHLVTVQTSGLGTNDTHVFNGATLLGTAHDGSPLSLFLDDGPLALNADANVDGADGTQFFFQGFNPPVPATLSAPVTTTAVYKTIEQIVDDGLASGAIHGTLANTIAFGLKNRFDLIQDEMHAHLYRAVLSQLKAFVSLVQFRSGNEIDPAFAKTLELDAMLVFHNALCKGVAGGQITAGAEANTNYSYYVGIVTAAGGTPLPPC
jgi:Divergent InlB B-repeat domain